MAETGFKELVQMDNNELRNIDKPFQKVRYKKNVKISETEELQEPKKKAKYDDVILCKYCGRTFKRSNRSTHNKTQLHLAYAKMNDKLRNLLLTK